MAAKKKAPAKPKAPAKKPAAKKAVRKNPARKAAPKSVVGSRHAVALVAINGGTLGGYLSGWDFSGPSFDDTTSQAMKMDLKTAKVLGEALSYYIAGEKFNKRFKVGIVNLGK